DDGGSISPAPRGKPLAPQSGGKPSALRKNRVKRGLTPEGFPGRAKGGREGWRAFWHVIRCRRLAVMLRFLFNRLWQSIATLFVIITVTFFLVRNAPGNAFQNERAVAEHILEQLKAAYGFDRPQLAQYGAYLKKALTGDLGVTMKYEGWTVSEI